MSLIETKIFKSGNSVAIRLPKGLGFEAGMPVTIEHVGNAVTVRPAVDTAEEKRKLGELMAKLTAIGPITPVGTREAIEFPDRPGLY